MIMSALRSGADGILVVGGAAGDCQAAKGQEGDRRRFVLLGNLLEFIGIESGRVHIVWESVLEGEQVRGLVQELTEKVKALGPASRLVKQIEPMQGVE
jgi:coenzyme F420-reducing hydrogenase delta subunit